MYDPGLVINDASPLHADSAFALLSLPFPFTSSNSLERFASYLPLFKTQEFLPLHTLLSARRQEGLPSFGQQSTALFP